MLRWVGALCILFGGLLGRQLRVATLRREMDTLSDLLSALCQMAEEIRMARTPLPQLLDRLGRERQAAVAAFFAAGSAAARQGENVAEVWRQAAKKLPLAPAAQDALAELGMGLGGDEESICKAISLACMNLSRSLEDLRRRLPETEKRTTALCLSASALLIILLI